MQMNNVPFDWKMNKLGHVADVFDGTHQTPEYVDHGIKFISAEDISDPSASTKYITHQAFENNFKIRPNKNDIFMTRIGRIGIPFLLKNDEDFAYYVTLALLKLKRDVVPEYLFYFIQGNYFQFELWKRTLHVAFPEKINKDEIGKCLVLYPDNITEQKKIAEILGTWDRAIEELTDLIAENKELKRGLMQRLLTGIQRLPGFTKPWKKIKLSDVLEECTETTTINNQYDILTSSRRGIFKQEDYFDKQVASQDNIGYKIIHNGDFTYRAMTDDGKFCFNQLTDLEIGIVSPAYAVFQTKKIPGNILKFILNSGRFGYELLKEAQGGTRKSLKYNSLIKLQIYVPDDEKEMDKLSDCLFVADSDIDLLNQQLDLLKEQKRGLMQKLLTGEIRVKVDKKD